MKLSVFVSGSNPSTIMITVILGLLVLLLGLEPLLMKKLRLKIRRQWIGFTQPPITSCKAENNLPLVLNEQSISQSNRGINPNRKRFLNIYPLDFSLKLHTEDLFICTDTVSRSVDHNEISNYS
ncbi:hypothetical protein [Acutalibacter sp.]|jgi:hypothetical protein|uniref:hypothetical protein n=1 Tax=Acutalibacter sp. TaxID=1918636 RepID=UPI0021710C98|nr:hypothetical protein [Acutalibacter sp.]